VIFQVPPGREQVVFTPEQWARAVLFLALDDDDEGLGLA
jgi:hypothetical protein